MFKTVETKPYIHVCDFLTLILDYLPNYAANAHALKFYVLPVHCILFQCTVNSPWLWMVGARLTNGFPLLQRILDADQRPVFDQEKLMGWFFIDFFIFTKKN